jgi:hypothetical protein
MLAAAITCVAIPQSAAAIPAIYVAVLTYPMSHDISLRYLGEENLNVQ